MLAPEVVALAPFVAQVRVRVVFGAAEAHCSICPCLRNEIAPYDQCSPDSARLQHRCLLLVGRRRTKRSRGKRECEQMLVLFLHQGIDSSDVTATWLILFMFLFRVSESERVAFTIYEKCRHICMSLHIVRERDMTCGDYGATMFDRRLLVRVLYVRAPPRPGTSTSSSAP